MDATGVRLVASDNAGCLRAWWELMVNGNYFGFGHDRPLALFPARIQFGGLPWFAMVSVRVRWTARNRNTVSKVTRRRPWLISRQWVCGALMRLGVTHAGDTRAGPHE